VHHLGSATPRRSRNADQSADWRGALVLISCAKAKLSRSAPARELYCSPAFRLKREIAERQGTPWLILSAKHGIVRPDQIIEPYDETLTSAGVAVRREWARRVLPILLPLASTYERLVCLAGHRYMEFLVPPLTDKGITVSEPLNGLRQGEQLSWLTRHR
jgi:hypothetical protein